ncbi:RING-type domain-containing protein [Citrus sinensis]|uniref:RING-type domain-containing protein n=1 Tax=Citrus sinensis TaxID=2711 RepID=A0ACB8HQA7_CITSI|nr:RING-type domain-containing protein [Citrus sinensis]
MGNIFAFLKQRNRSISISRISSSRSTSASANHRYPSMSKQASSVSTSGTSSAAASATPKENIISSARDKMKKKYSFIPDNFSSLEQVTAALRDSGLESSNLILGIDFTKSNEWTGKVSFNNRSLHAIGDTPNPYEKAITIIGKTLAPFDEDNLIPCFGFGDATTHDQEVFSFHDDHTPCHGFEEVLACYRNIVPNLRLAGPTSYAPVVEAAMDIVEKSGGQYHVLVIIADGQVTRSVNTGDGELSSQEQKTIKSIVAASSYPLSIVLVGVGDGPWEDMQKFDDKIPAREFDNFQFVNFTAIMSKNATPSEKETAFALAALMEIPIQYKAAVELGIMGESKENSSTTSSSSLFSPCPARTSTKPWFNPCCGNPGMMITLHACLMNACPICLTNAKDLAFGCGHMTCRECGSRVSNCPICRQRITNRLRLFA